MTPTERLKEIEYKLTYVTGGPWEWGTTVTPKFTAIVYVKKSPHDEIVRTKSGYDTANAEFISSAREDVPWLIARVKRLTEALEKISLGETQFNDSVDQMYIARKALEEE